MNISFNWLKQYVPTDLTAEETARALTSIGLETGGIEEVESIPGGLRGLVIGKVLTCLEHENSDHLHVTTVDIGAEEPLQIVCGAPNVAAGKAVVVATIGTVLGSGDDVFTIKRSKIRGVESFGMLCSEVEIGVGTSNDGIILLDPDQVRIGMPAAEYFGVQTDQVLEVDITPNRVDATSHFGVARDLAAYLTQYVAPVRATLPQVNALPTDGVCPVAVRVSADASACPRYQGVVVRGVKVTESPQWLKFYLESIGLRPINSVVDITNFVLHEYGQPLHAYDLRYLGGSIEVGFAQEGKSFVGLDAVERKLTGQDLVIASASGEPLCLAGVMGGLNSGTTFETTDIFLESANFNPSLVRKSARRAVLNTDSSFRFERGLDPNRTQWALERAVSLILELSPEARVERGIFDHYPKVAEPFSVDLSLSRMSRLIGQDIPEDQLLQILQSLEIEVKERQSDIWKLAVPCYRVDVTREVDVIEEVLRIYGYNQIETTGYVHANLSTQNEQDRSYRRRLRLSEQLVGAGFSEILNNSLSAESYYDTLSSFPSSALVRLQNPLSAELNVMRQTLLFGGLSSISRNLRRQQKSLYFFEWGNCYSFSLPQGDGEQTPSLSDYQESMRLGIWIAGERVQNSWAHPNEPTSPFELKAYVEHLLERLGLQLGKLKLESVAWDIYAGTALQISTGGGKLIGRIGEVSSKLTKRFDIDIPVYFAELEWATLQREAERASIKIGELPKFPVVKRDLSFLLDTKVQFADIEALARRVEKKYLKSCELFDVYEGKKLPAGKKSYATSFYLQDEDKTMSDKQIEIIMDKIRRAIETELGGELR